MSESLRVLTTQSTNIIRSFKKEVDIAVDLDISIIKSSNTLPLHIAHLTGINKTAFCKVNYDSVPK